MKIESTAARGNFKILNGNECLLEVTYANWFASKAETTFKNTKLEIKPKNIWQSKFSILKNDIPAGSITFNWKGHIIINTLDQEHLKTQYVLRAKGFWHMGFELLDAQEHQLLFLKPNLSWRKVNYNYEIQDCNQELSDSLIELLVYAGFSANLYMTTMLAG